MMIALAVLISSLPHSPSLQTWKPVYEFQVSHWVVHLSWQDSSTLVVGTLDGVLETWDIRKKRMVKQVLMGREVRAFIFTTKGGLFTLHADGTVALRSAQTGEVLRTFDFGDEGKYGKRHVVGIGGIGQGRIRVVIWDARHEGRYEYVDLDPDMGVRSSSSREEWPLFYSRMGHFAEVDEDGNISIFDARTGNRLRNIKVNVGVKWEQPALAFSGEDTKIAVYDVIASVGSVHVVSVKSGKLLFSIRNINKGVRGVVFSHNGKTILVLEETQAQLYSATDGKKITFYRVVNAGPAAFSEGDNYVAIGHYQYSTSLVRVFKVP